MLMIGQARRNNLQRQDESRQGGGGPNLAQRPPTRREARTPDTGQGQNTAGGGQGGRGA